MGLNREQIAEIVNHAMTFQYGGMSQRELEEIGNICDEKVVLELGSMVGMSTYIIGSVGKHVDTVDVWSDTQDHLSHDPEQANVYASYRELTDMYGAFLNNCNNLLKSKKITPYRGKTKDMAIKFKAKKYDVILFDADHSYQGVSEDYNNYKNKLKDSGVYVFHDWGDTMWKSIQIFTSELTSKNELEFIYNVERIGVFKKNIKKDKNE